MSLSNELISQFVKVTKDNKQTKTETTVYGTIKEYNGSKYVQLDGSELLTPISSTTDAVADERVTVMIKNHTAIVTGNISSPAARTDDVQEIGNKISDFEIVIADKVDTKQLNAQIARIDSLQTDNVTIKNALTANEASISQLTADNATINEKLTANEASIEKLQTDKLDANVAEITYATIDDLEATNIEVNNLEATYGDFAELTTKDITAINATIDKLDTKYASIENLDTERARIDDLETNSLTADSAVVKDLQADVADIDTLIFGSASGDVIHTSFANAVIAQLGDAQIKSAMIENVSASKISAGDIITNNVRVLSEDGKLLISDETIQISDDTRVRVQIGKDAAGDYSINVWDVDGNLMFSEGGITDDAIKEAIIRDDMVSDFANISAHKLNIESLFEEINGSTQTIKSSKIYFDDKAQTLNVAFTNLSSDVDTLENITSSQGTELSVIQGQIANRVWKQDVNDATDTMNTKYSLLEQTVDDINVVVANHTSVISEKADKSEVSTVVDQVSELEVSLSGFKTTVSNAYATKTEMSMAQASIRQNANNITLSATKTELSNVSDIATQAYDNTLAQADVLNYAQLNDNTASKWGFTADETADGHWYTMNVLSRHKIISGWHECVGGERFRITFEISTSFKGNSTNGGTDSVYQGTAIGLYGYDAEEKSVGISYSDRTMASEGAPITSVSSIVTINNNARKFKVGVKTESHGNFSGSIRIRNVRVEKIDKVLEDRIKKNETSIIQNSESIKAAAQLITNNETDIASLELTASGLTSRVSETEKDVENALVNAAHAQEDIDNLEIGGRNLFEHSAELSTSAIGQYFAPEAPPYTVTREEDSKTPSGSCAVCAIGEISTAITNGGFYLSGPYGNYVSKMIIGETYTVSVWVKGSRNMNYGAMTAEFLKDVEVINRPNLSTEWQRYIIRGTYNGHTTSSIAITFYYNTLLRSNDVFYFSSPQIEKGNRATDWNVASEDMATAKDVELAQNTADGAQETATHAETLVQQLSDSISMLVTDGNGSTLMTQTESGWTFSTSNIESSVTTTANALNKLNAALEGTNGTVDVLKQAVDDLGEIAEYVKISTYEDEPCIELGEGDSDFKLRITNTRIMFLEGSDVVAYINNQSLNIKKAVIEEELQQGGFVWKVRSNGNIGLVWKGVG